MFTPPVTVPSGQSVVYCVASVFTATSASGAAASVTATSGAGLISNSHPVNPQTYDINWGTFTLPSVFTNPGVVVHNIYPFINLNGSVSSSNSIVHLNGSLISGTGGVFNISYHTASLGTSLSSIAGVTAEAFGEATLPIGPISDYVNITAVGVAVYIDSLPLPSAFVNVGKQQYKNVGFN
jgi:hypothetical protein